MRRHLRFTSLIGALAWLLVSALPVWAQVYATGTVSALSTGGNCTNVANSCASFTVPSPVVSMTLQVSGTFTGTLTFEASSDAAQSTWSVISLTALNGASTVTTATAPGQFSVGNTGLTGLRARSTAWSSGTATVTAAYGFGSLGGGSGASTVTINDPNTPTQKVAVNGSGQMSITCANCSGSGASAVDESTFTQGTNSVAPMGGLFKNSYTALTTGQVGIAQMTSDGSVYTNLFRVGGSTLTLGQNTMANSLPVSFASNQSNLPTNTAQVNGATVVTAASGVQKVGVTGNTGAAVDAAGQNAAAPANELLVGAQFNTSPTTITTGNMSPLQVDSAANLLVKVNTALPTGANVIGALTANQSVNVAQINGNTTSTAASGTQKVGISGNTGAALDAAGQNVASPANELLVGAQFNTTPTTVVTGNMSPLQIDSAGNLLVNIKAGGGTGGGPADVGVTTAASETDANRQKVTSAIRWLDTTQTAGSQLVAAKGDGTNGLFVNCKAGCSTPADTVGSAATINGAGVSATVALAGLNSTSVQLTSSTSPVFTLVSECSQDGGTTYTATVSFITSAGVTSTTLANPANGNYALVLPIGCTGATHVRVRANPYTSGSIIAQLRATAKADGRVTIVDAAGNTMANLNAGRVTVLADINNPSASATEAATYTTGTTGVAETIGFTQYFNGTTWARWDSRVNVNQWNGQALASPDANSYPIVSNAATATATAALSVCNILSAASTNATNCKGSAGNFYGYEIYNTTTTVYYLRLYNLATAPTCSSATGFIRSIPIPPASASGQVGGAVSNQAFGATWASPAGIGYCITGGSSSTDNTNAAVGVFGEIRYR